MRKFILLGLLTLSLVGCSTQVERGSLDSSYYGIYTYHDDSRAVTCWVYGGKGISCLPDSEVKGV